MIPNLYHYFSFVRCTKHLLHKWDKQGLGAWGQEDEHQDETRVSDDSMMRVRT